MNSLLYSHYLKSTDIKLLYMITKKIRIKLELLFSIFQFFIYLGVFGLKEIYPVYSLSKLTGLYQQQLLFGRETKINTIFIYKNKIS